MNDNPTTVEWTVESVIKSGGEQWVGLANINTGSGLLGSMNNQVALAVVAAHNAALAAEREKARAGGWLSEKALDEYAKVEAEHRQFETEIQQLRKQLAAKDALAKMKEGK